MQEQGHDAPQAPADDAAEHEADAAAAEAGAIGGRSGSEGEDEPEG